MSPKLQSDGKKCLRSNQREKVMVAENAIKMEKRWRKMPSKWKSGGGKCHQTSKVMAKSATTFKSGGTLATTYHIQGAGAPAKTKNYVNADAFKSSPNLCVHSSSSYVSPSMLPLSSGDLIEWSLVCHSTLSYQKFCDRHSNHYDHPEELHQSVE